MPPMMSRWPAPLGLEVAIVAGDEDNIKITLPGDFLRAERILAQRMKET